MPRICIIPIVLGLFCGSCFPFSSSLPFAGYLNDEGVMTSPGMLKGSEIRSRVSLLAAFTFLVQGRQYCTSNSESEYDKTGCRDEVYPTIEAGAQTIGLAVQAILDVDDSAYYNSMGNCRTHTFFQTRIYLMGMNDNEKDDGTGRVDFAETRAQIRAAALIIPFILASFCSEVEGGLLSENDIRTSM